MSELLVRYGVTKRWSDAVVHGNTAYFVEVPDDPVDNPVDESVDDPGDQFHQVFRQVEDRLVQVGSDLTKLIQVIVYLPYPSDLPLFNELWDRWIPDGYAPVRACIHAPLASPKYRVELIVTAQTTKS